MAHKQSDKNTQAPIDLKSNKSVTVSSFKGSVNGSLSIPGSKSYSNRMLLAAALANGPSTVKNLLDSDDISAMKQALAGLGISVQTQGTDTIVNGCGGAWPNTNAKISVGSAGTTARFLTAALALSAPSIKKNTSSDQDSATWFIDASEQMRKRPIKDLMDILESLGAKVDYQLNDGSFPLTLSPTEVQSKTIQMSGKLSSQFVSAMIMAAPLCTDTLTINITDHIVQSDYVNITIDVLKRFGVHVDVNESFDSFSISSQPYKPSLVIVEPDASTATYFMALAACTAGDIVLENLTTHTAQPDIEFLNILKDMGCKIEESPESITVKGPKKLKGGFDIDMKPLSDASLTLAALAPFADAPIRFYGVKHIRHHECDRLSAMSASLTAMGIKHEEFEDGLHIYPGKPKHVELDPYDDHRMAMALTIMGLAGDGVTISNPACVSKTCPTFFNMMQSLGVTITQTS